MNFKSRRISRTRPVTVKDIAAKNQKIKNKFKNPFTLPHFQLKLPKKLVSGLILSLVIITLGFAAFQFTPAKSIVTKSILKTIGSNIKKDSAGYTNILAIGIGGEGHEGGQLTDTIIVASINEKNGKVIMTSIPRDLYAKHDNIISQRVNSVYENTKHKLGEELALATLSEIIGDFTGEEIHYYVKIDFKGLRDIVNALGGVEIYNKEAIYDPFYPGPNYSYQTFSLPIGTQNLDGETALKFARSRKTTNDFSRSDRQQQLILAIKEKALKLDILSSPDRLNELYKSIEANVGTNLSFREITTLAAIASDIGREDLVQIIFNDDPNSKGGFLYSPPRSLYAEAYVLIPADKTLTQVHTFIKLHREFPELMKNPIPIDVLNGTKTSGLAGETAFVLQKFGFETNDIKNMENRDIEVEKSKIQSSIGTNNELIDAIKLLFPPVKKIESIDPVLPNPEEDGLPASIKLVVGKDMISTLKFFDTHSSLAPLIQQAIRENQAANADEEAAEDEEINNPDLSENTNSSSTSDSIIDIETPTEVTPENPNLVTI
jgi:LCP family protein required for cell wall assembly